MVQDHVLARAWRFKSSLRHHLFSIRYAASYFLKNTLSLLSSSKRRKKTLTDRDPLRHHHDDAFLCEQGHGGKGVRKGPGTGRVQRRRERGPRRQGMFWCEGQEPGPGVGSRGSVRAVYSSFMNPCLFLFLVLDVLRLHCLEQVNFAVGRGFNMMRCI